MESIKQLRRRLLRFKKKEVYTWKEVSCFSGLGEPWLHKFADNKCVDYRGEHLRKLLKFLNKMDGNKK